MSNWDLRTWPLLEVRPLSANLIGWVKMRSLWISRALSPVTGVIMKRGWEADPQAQGRGRVKKGVDTWTRAGRGRRGLPEPWRERACWCLCCRLLACRVARGHAPAVCTWLWSLSPQLQGQRSGPPCHGASPLDWESKQMPEAIPMWRLQVDRCCSDETFVLVTPTGRCPAGPLGHRELGVTVTSSAQVFAPPLVPRVTWAKVHSFTGTSGLCVPSWGVS